MSNLDKDTKNLLVVALIGGVLGICVTSIYLASKDSRKSTLSQLGRVALQVGEILNHHDIKAAPFVKDVEKKIHKHEDVISDVISLISTGIHLWDKIKKGL